MTKRRRKARVAFAMAAGLFSSGCGLPLLQHRQQARVFIPPPPPSPPVIEPTPPLPEAPASEVAEVSIPVPLSKATNSTTANLVDLPPPPPPPVKRPPPAPPKVQANTTPVPSEPPTVVPPKLGQIFTREQYREYNQSLAESFARVDSALARLEGKRLTAEQSVTADRIRSFRKQAEQAREQDLVTAVSLARRADLLAKDLLGRLP